jgi:hypothetical protein
LLSGRLSHLRNEPIEPDVNTIFYIVQEGGGIQIERGSRTERKEGQVTRERERTNEIDNPFLC